ncbi:MAG TPA: hypothetical protein VES42_26240 [Pilimelia sp.]|nr:hypothetical protein [Pilimelia sp.]
MKTSGKGLGALFARAGMALALAAGLVSVPLAAPASAAGNCNVAGSRAAIWERTFSVVLYRTKTCTYYTKLTNDDALWSVGVKFTFKVERQQKTPYGWYITETKQRVVLGGGEGNWNTGTVEGWWPTYWEEDNHRACYSLSHANPPTGWKCTGWVGI